MSKQEIRIVTKIIRELSLFLMLHGYNTFQLNTYLEGKTRVFMLDVENMASDTLETMREKIGRKRELEVETYGWELLGDTDTKNELEIIGLLIDSLDITTKDHRTRLVLKRESKYLEK
ncbi:MAG: hypothetical protein EA374_07260 [Acholeplasmatales bacterium]|nr:MAG: hypothetical protein EA374_07260 [Acholeplasmatales bacterium]